MAIRRNPTVEFECRRSSADDRVPTIETRLPSLVRRWSTSPSPSAGNATMSFEPLSDLPSGTFQVSSISSLPGAGIPKIFSLPLIFFEAL